MSEGLTSYSIAQLIDRLIVQHLKCWHSVEIVQDYRGKNVSTLTDRELRALAEAGQRAEATNTARAKLVAELDRRISELYDKEAPYEDPKL